MTEHSLSVGALPSRSRANRGSGRLRDGTLTQQEKEENRRISSVHVRTEHVTGDIKRYRVIHDIIRSICFEFRDKVMETCFRLQNFRIRLKHKDCS